MVLYLDSSFCAALYFPENGTILAERTVKSWQGQVCTSLLGEIEMASACQLRAFRGQFSADQAQIVWNRVETDIRDGIIVVEPITSVVFARAKNLALNHSSSTGARTLDIIHVAAALAAGADQFASFDTKQRALAKLVGLKVTPRSLP